MTGHHGTDCSNSSWPYRRGLTIAFLVTSFFIWNSRQRNERLAVGLFIGGLVIVVVLVVVVASH